MSPRSDATTDDTLLERFSPVGWLVRGLKPAGPSRWPCRRGPRAPGTTTDRAQAAPDLPRLFPEFVFERVLNRGGFGTVHLVRHRHSSRRLAIKILDPGLAGDAPAVARFEREVATTMRLTHPGIVRVFDAGRRGTAWFLAMEFIEGSDLESLARAAGPLAAAEATDLIRQAALALHHAHELGLVHRDIKPTNLMLAAAADSSGPRVKLLDFGMVRLRDDPDGILDLTLSTEFLGTIDYVPPEQIRAPGRVDHRADLYGLGATLYRLLAGRSPHARNETSGSSLYTKLLRIADEPTPALVLARPDLDPRVLAIVDRLLARDPDQRFGSAMLLAEALAPLTVGADLSGLLARSRAGSGPGHHPVEGGEGAEPRSHRSHSGWASHGNDAKKRACGSGRGARRRLLAWATVLLTFAAVGLGLLLDAGHGPTPKRKPAEKERPVTPGNARPRRGAGRLAPVPSRRSLPDPAHRTVKYGLRSPTSYRR